MSVNKRKKSGNTQRSQKTVHEDAPTTMEKRQKKKAIVSFLSITISKGVIGLRQDFVQLRRFNDFEKMKAFQTAQDDGRNRYKDVGCLDNNRVKLNAPWPHDYIHGNYVSVPSNPKRFICTQAPLEKTCADFWFMCLQDRVEYIFMLCNFTEKQVKKCHEYYPTSKKKTLEFTEGNHKITVKYESSNKVKFSKEKDKEKIKVVVTETIISVEGPNDTSIKTVHYHWNDWPDRGCPQADMAIVELLDRARHSKGPIVVHCSAGIGRTGSVVMIEYMMDQFINGQPIEDGDKILVKIREQRNNSVQTEFQYLFVHEVMLNFFAYKKLFDANALLAVKGFSDEYYRALR
ncbi:unnamed protein product [Caenorhabditis sp. 36 PRJEB53466]|nr:unnamed protein product [Caenorhabditis sp. 36 PRJEB53466]